MADTDDTAVSLRELEESGVLVFRVEELEELGLLSLVLTCFLLCAVVAEDVEVNPGTVAMAMQNQFQLCPCFSNTPTPPNTPPHVCAHTHTY